MITGQFIALAPQFGRKVARCKICRLVQWDNDRRCIRCHAPKYLEQCRPTPERIETESDPHTAADYTIDVGGAVRVMRLALGMSQPELAKKCDMPRTYLSRVENGMLSMRPNNAMRLACALQIPLDVLMDMGQAIGDYSRRHPA